ncbi:autotransporter domain-containing protein [Bradyrhizobium amphicarpaeae]|nr:autotransporter domain-containing protein [Bradyrhizobium amphicarpaeae]
MIAALNLITQVSRHTTFIRRRASFRNICLLGSALGGSLACAGEAYSQAFNATPGTQDGSITYNRADPDGPGTERITVNAAGAVIDPPAAVISWALNNNQFMFPGHTATFQGAPGNGNYEVLNRLDSGQAGTFVIDGTIVGRLSALNPNAAGTLAFSVSSIQGQSITVGSNAVFDVNRVKFQSDPNYPNAVTPVIWNGTFTTRSTGGGLFLENSDFTAAGGSIGKSPGANLTTLDLQSSTFRLGNTSLGLDAVQMTDSAFLFNGGAPNATRTLTQAFTLNGADFMVIDDSRKLTLTGPIDGGGSLGVSGSGTIVLAGVNTYTGTTNVVQGTLEVAGSIAATSSVVATAGAIVQVDNAGALGAAPVLLSDGTLRTNFNGSFTNDLTFAGGAVSTVSAAAGTQVTLNGPVSMGSGTTARFGSPTDTGTVVYQPNIGAIDVSSQVVVAGGKLLVNGALAAPAMITVNSGATLGGTGLLGNTTIHGGGVFAPGPQGAPGSMTVFGNLAFQSGAVYLIQVTPGAASTALVNGTANLSGGSVQTVFAPGNYITRQYTILSAAGGLAGTTFTGVSGGPGFQQTLSYTATDVVLNLTAALGNGSAFNQNQQNVLNTVNNFFNSGGALPAAYANLFALSGANLGNALTTLSGEIATGSQQSTFDAMNQFMGVLTDPFIGGRGNPTSGGGNPNAFANEDERATSRSGSERDAYAAISTKAPLAALPFAQRWAVWEAGFGGSQRTDGNAVVGSNNTSSNLYGVAVGADYRFSPDTIAGFALAGGGTNFSVNGLGSGRSDLFQAGGFVRHNVGPAYITAALAYGWQDVTTDRAVTIAGLDRLRARFHANAWSGRVEGGYRIVGLGVGWTPYAAGQFTTFDLPAYAEQADSGSNAFALSYAGRTVTAPRSELGLRTDKSFAMEDGILTLRGRAAWAYNFTTDRNALPTFQALPGASFVVNGAAQAANAALVTGAAEMKWINGWSVATTFDGEFSNVTRSYAGKGIIRYAW